MFFLLYFPKTHCELEPIKINEVGNFSSLSKLIFKWLKMRKV